MQKVERFDLLPVDLLEEFRLVNASDNLGFLVVLANGLKKLKFRLDFGFRQKDIGSPRKMPYRFP